MRTLAARSPPLTDLQSAFCCDAQLWPGMLHDLRFPAETHDHLQGELQGMLHGLWCLFVNDIPLQGQCCDPVHSLTGASTSCCQELSLTQSARLC